MSVKNSSQHNLSQGVPEMVYFAKAEVTALFGEVLKSGLSLRVTVTGRSMAPFLSGGEVVTIKKVPAWDLWRGDLILFDSSQGYPVLHRIVRKKRSVGGAHIFQTRGDALKSLDGPVQHTAILGKVSKIERTHTVSGSGHVDMESPVQRMINYIRAMVNLIESDYYYALLSRLKRVLIRP